MDTKKKQRTLKRKHPELNEETPGQQLISKWLVPKGSSLSRAPLRDVKNTLQQNNPTTSCTELGSDQNENHSPDDRITHLMTEPQPSVSPLLPQHSHQTVCPSSAHLPIYNGSNGSTIVAPQINNNKAGGSINVNVTITNPQPDPSTLASQSSATRKDDHSRQKVQEKHAATMKKRTQNTFELTSRTTTPLNDFFIEIDNIEGETAVDENEVLKPSQGPTITRDDLFKPLPGQDKEIRTVMTKGDAGIGKTITVHKFILDWADKLTNRDLEFVFSFSVRELNFLKRPLSLLSLLKSFHKDLIDTDCVINFNTKTTLIILDGLDESTLPLDCHNYTLTDETQEAPVDVLITNLLKGNLLPEACIWITSRPAAAKQIDVHLISRVTEMLGFNDKQKNDYFRKKFNSNENLGSQVISHINKTESLHIMCRIPVFSCISAIVLENQITNGSEDIPKTVTELYTHFLLIQTNLKNTKYFEKENPSGKMKDSDKDMILKLAKLAFTSLEKDKFLFSEDDLNEQSIDISKASVHSGLFTEVLRKEYGLYSNSAFCFVHRTVQELFAALYLLHCFANDDFEVLRSFLYMEFVEQAKAESLDALLGYNSQNSEDTSEDESSSLEEDSEEMTNDLLDNEARESRMSSKKITLHDLPLHVLLKSAVYRALESKNGHLDMMLRFLLGLSLKQNRGLLNELLPKMVRSAESLKQTKEYITERLNSSESDERCINLLSCLAEMGDHTLHEKVQKYLTADIKLTPELCTTLAYIKSMEALDVFDLSTYKATEKGRQRLLTILPHSRKAILAGCNISGRKSYKMIASALTSPNSVLRELDLSYNDLRCSSLWLLMDGLQSPDCKLQILCLKQCNLTAKDCDDLVNALENNQSLRELDLADNDLQDSGVKLLTTLSRLESLNLSSCGVTEESCVSLSVALSSNSLQLKELDLSDNDFGDTGVKLLSKGLADQNCKLQTLRLTGCLLTVDSYYSLAEALRSNMYMQLLDLSYNHLEGTKILPSGQRTQIKSDYNDKCYLKPGKKKYACEMTLDPYTASDRLILSEEDKMASWVDEEQYCRPHPERFITCPQVLCTEVLSGCHYWEVKWEGRGAHVGVAYKTINRKQEGHNCLLGYNDQSWTLYITNRGRVKLSAWHNNKSKDIQVPLSDTDKVGVYLNWSQGTLSFYGVTSDSQTHLHTFLVSKFTGPLCPAFWVCPNSKSSILLR